MANIIAAVIVAVMPEVAGKLKEHGRFLASGIIKERLPEVEAAAAKQGLQILDVQRKAGWCAVTMGRTM